MIGKPPSLSQVPRVALWLGGIAAVTSAATTFLLLTTFLIGTLSYGIALASGGTPERLLALLFLLAAPLTVIIMLDGYFGASLSGWIAWSYPLLQPLSRALTGAWLIWLATSRYSKGRYSAGRSSPAARSPGS